LPDFYDFACFLPILTTFDERSIAFFSLLHFKLHLSLWKNGKTV